MKVLVADPGLTTGWVVFKPVSRMKIDVLAHGETRGEAEFTAIAWELNRQEHVGRCVCEAFRPWQDNKARTWQPEALHIIGALRFIFGISEVDLRQSASDAHNWGIKERMDPYRIGPNRVRSPGGHADMALRHGLLWTATKWDGLS